MEWPLNKHDMSTCGRARQIEPSGSLPNEIVGPIGKSDRMNISIIKVGDSHVLQWEKI